MGDISCWPLTSWGKNLGPVEAATGRPRPKWRDVLPQGISELAPIAEGSELTWRPDEEGDWDEEEQASLAAEAPERYRPADAVWAAVVLAAEAAPPE